MNQNSEFFGIFLGKWDLFFVTKPKDLSAKAVQHVRGLDADAVLSPKPWKSFWMPFVTKWSRRRALAQPTGHKFLPGSARCATRGREQDEGEPGILEEAPEEGLAILGCEVHADDRDFRRQPPTVVVDPLRVEANLPQRAGGTGGAAEALDGEGFWNFAPLRSLHGRRCRG